MVLFAILLLTLAKLLSHAQPHLQFSLYLQIQTIFKKFTTKAQKMTNTKDAAIKPGIYSSGNLLMTRFDYIPWILIMHNNN